MKYIHMPVIKEYNSFITFMGQLIPLFLEFNITNKLYNTDSLVCTIFSDIKYKINKNIYI